MWEWQSCHVYVGISLRARVTCLFGNDSCVLLMRDLTAMGGVGIVCLLACFVCPVFV